MFILELFDIVDENGMPSGGTVERGKAHAEGILHRTAHIWIVRETGGRQQVLLQKRSADKDSFPGRFDTSSAGHIQAGDEPRESALRELKEELGIEAEKEDLDYAGTFRIQYDLEFHGKPFRDNEVAFVYVYRKETDETQLILQKEEVECAEWFDMEETYRACIARDQKFCVPIGGLKVLMSYLEKNPEH
jgi:isopentenyldiphosphate isomerase